MSEEANPAKTSGKKWTKWSVVEMANGAIRCRRTNVEDGNDHEYRQVSLPSFSVEELTAMIEFGSRGLMPQAELARQCFNARYRDAAFHLCGLLNSSENGTSL